MIEYYFYTFDRVILNSLKRSYAQNDDSGGDVCVLLVQFMAAVFLNDTINTEQTYFMKKLYHSSISLISVGTKLLVSGVTIILQSTYKTIKSHCAAEISLKTVNHSQLL